MIKWQRNLWEDRDKNNKKETFMDAKYDRRWKRLFQRRQAMEKLPNLISYDAFKNDILDDRKNKANTILWNDHITWELITDKWKNVKIIM